ncbi:MAG: OmpH family outer membrane protein [Lutibacter sp.]|uniref:OmpH family outer membrane protein n=1 Tax=Lutibacter sp. TaxID=1925666 RepID=UPI00299D5FBD|nr:OmpH family outer membrane protein [Lutibacter sp.]MDX1829607.1 OmpH family outer membrane protein [Lutibacter sp.]
MKKIILIVFAIMLVSCNQTKIGYVNVENLMKDYKATEVLQTKLKSKQEKVSKQLDSLQAPFKAKVQNYYQKAKSMSASTRAKVEKELQQEQQMLQYNQQQAAQKLQKENQDESEKITKRVDSLVAVFAKANGYQLILGTSGNGTVMYGDTTLDVTDKVLDILNKDFDKK